MLTIRLHHDLVQHEWSPVAPQDAYLWLDWISIPQIVEDSDMDGDNGDETREISGRLRRRSRGLRMSLRSFRGLDGDGGLLSYD